MAEVLIRKPVSYLLVLTMWFASVALVPIRGFAQQTDPAVTADASKDSKTKNSKKDKNNKAEPAPTPDAGTQTAGNTKPLSTKEDPSQIGKRSLNTGANKFFVWLGGSKEKEMQIDVKPRRIVAAPAKKGT